MACTTDRPQVVLDEQRPLAIASDDRHTCEITARAGQFISGFVHQDSVELPDSEVSVRFDAAADGVVDTATLVQNGKYSTQHVANWQPDASELAACAGRYYSDELDTFYRVSLDGEELMISHLRHNDSALSPEQKEVFRYGEWFSGTVNFDRDQDENIAALRMSNGRVRNLLFERVD